MKWLIASFCLALALFCGFGFLASFESTDHQLLYRAGYSIIGLCALSGVIFPFLRTQKSPA